MSFPTVPASLPVNSGTVATPVATTTFTASFAGGGAHFDADLPDGLYTLTLVEAEQISQPNKFKPGTISQQVIWKFTVDGREGDGQLGYYTSKSMHEKSKLPGLLDALQVPAPTADNPNVDIQAIYGKKVKALVKNEAGKNDPSRRYPRIKELLRA